MSLVLYKYINGETRTFDSVIELEAFENVNTIIGDTITVNMPVTISGDDGDQYALGWEYTKIIGSQGSLNTAQAVITVAHLGGGFNVLDADVEPYKRLYEIELDYQIASVFEAPEDLETLTQPGYLDGDGSLTDNFDVKFFPEWNNPNTIVQNILSETRRLGNTGWFNENFNELDNEFETLSVVYRNTDGQIVESLDYTQPTDVEITIGNVAVINANSRFGFGFMYIPENETDYKELETPFYRNVFASNGSNTDSYAVSAVPFPAEFFGSGVNGGAMNGRNVHFREVDGNLVFSVRFEPNATFSNIFDAKEETDRQYILYVSLDDNDQVERNFSNRVTLLCDLGTLVENIPPAGAYENIDNAFIEHPENESVVGVELYEGFVQDDLLSRLNFLIPKDGSIGFNRFSFAIELYNVNTEQFVTLENYDVDLTQFPVDANDVLQIDFEAIRGFKLNEGNNKNWVRVQRNDAADNTDFNAYVAYYGFKIRWEDWLQNPNIPGTFFNADELNNGFNNDWLTLLRTDGWRIDFVSKILAVVENELVEYKNRYPFTFNDYDENTLVTTEHNYYRHSDNTNINAGTEPVSGAPLGVILSNEETRIEIIYTIQDSGVWDLANTYGVITIEIDRGAGILEQRQLSSVWASEGDNPLRPLANEDNLKLSVDGTNKILTTECLVDPALLEDGALYRITGRVGCYNSGGGVIINGVYEPAYEEAYE